MDPDPIAEKSEMGAEKDWVVFGRAMGPISDFSAIGSGSMNRLDQPQTESQQQQSDQPSLCHGALVIRLELRI
jgi:hypothetical protein